MAAECLLLVPVPVSQSFNPSHSPPRKLRASAWRGGEREVVSPSFSCHRSVGVAQLTGKICAWLVSFWCDLTR